MTRPTKNAHDLVAKDSAGRDFPFIQFRGKPLLVVNVASKCGLTPQYAGLESLYQKYRSRGLSVVGFPCNQFGAQEPGSDSEIQQFCQLNYGVSFPVLAKIDVNGPNESPVYTYLKANGPGPEATMPIKWNFAKFLIGADGKVLQRYAPTTEPAALEADLEKVLSQ